MARFGMRLQLMASVLAAASLFTANPRADERNVAPQSAKIFFVDLKDGQIIPVKSTIRFGISGMALAPANAAKPNTGHYHLLIDTELPPLDRPIPSDFNHLHFGRGQTSAEVTLTPGEHTLQLLLGDHHHVPHDPPVVSKVLRVTVSESAGAGALQAASPASRQPSPPDAAVYFAYPRDGAVIYPKSTIRFGLRNMGVAPAGLVSANTGHHHLIIDAAIPPVDMPIPNDPNHLHFDAGQTEAKLNLTPGKHTLQLILGDDRHVPHDPPVVSAKINITVGYPKSVSPTKSPSPKGAEAYFHSPVDGMRVPQRFTARLGLRGMGLAPASIVKPGTGHHHLLIDVENVDVDRPIPSDANHIHLGNGQTEVVITLPPGRHTLQLLAGDHRHVPHDPPVMSRKLTIHVR